MSKSVKLANDPLLQAAIASGATEIEIVVGGKPRKLRLFDESNKPLHPESMSAVQEAFANARLERMTQLFDSLRNDEALERMSQSFQDFGKQHARLTEVMGALLAEMGAVRELLQAEVVPEYDASGRVKGARRVLHVVDATHAQGRG